jgi:hypothetical protein
LEGDHGRAPAPEKTRRTQATFLPEPSPVEAAVAALDIDALTPLEAIQKLYELRALTARGGP